MKIPQEPKSADVLILVDVINDLAFSGGKSLLRAALSAGENIAKLKARARRLSIPTVYVNDNFGRWRSDFRQQVEHCLSDECVGRPLVDLLKPDPEDYFVLKPMHSGFYGTSLEILLKRFEARRLILTGFATDICVLYTANDAYMRGYRLAIPEDCVACETHRGSRLVLEHMRKQLRAVTTQASRLKLQRAGS